MTKSKESPSKEYLIHLKETLSEFEVRFYERFAEKFVDKYIEEGRLQAGVYAVSHIRKENHKIAKPFIDEAFLRRGYVC